MEDGSSIRTKVAQYFVNKRLQELESKDPKKKIDGWTFLQTLSQYDSEHTGDQSESQALTHEFKPELGVNEFAAPSPIFPIPIGDHVSWKSLLELDKNRRTHDLPHDQPKPSFPPDQSKFPPSLPKFPPWYYVAIIGAGVAGLRTAKLLQDWGIPYKIFEASSRPGGRLFTYQFAQKNSQRNHDYYDVGAMRFLDNDANKKTFECSRNLVCPAR